MRAIVLARLRAFNLRGGLESSRRVLSLLLLVALIGDMSPSMAAPISAEGFNGRVQGTHGATDNGQATTAMGQLANMFVLASHEISSLFLSLSATRPLAVVPGPGGAGWNTTPAHYAVGRRRTRGTSGPQPMATNTTVTVYRGSIGVTHGFVNGSPTPPCNYSWTQDSQAFKVAIFPNPSSQPQCLNTTTITTTLKTPLGTYHVYPTEVDANGIPGDNPVVTVNVVPRPETPACGDCSRKSTTLIGDHPVDAVNGEELYSKTDLSLSGPFGLSFTRTYANQTIGSSDLGASWQHSYGSHLDTSLLSSGKVIVYDASGLPMYFSGVAAGAASYDNISQTSLALNSAGSVFTLSTFSNQQWTFNSLGDLIGQRDRRGNQQTIARDAAGGHADRILKISDPLGRELCFFYDSSNRITALSWLASGACPSTVPSSGTVVKLQYDSGPFCSTGQLCAVTEPDGATWKYEYQNDGTPFSNNLTAVIDPLGDPEEITSYQEQHVLTQQTGYCPTSLCPDTGGVLTFGQPAADTTTVTDGQNRVTTMTHDLNTWMLTKISGPLCKCGGDQTRGYVYDADDRLKSVTDDAIGSGTQHTISYTYGRDSGGKAYPGPTSISEVLDLSGATRATTIQYYPVGDPRQDLPNITTRQSVNLAGHSMTITDTYDTSGDLTQRSTAGYAHGVQTTITATNTFDTRGRIKTSVGPRQSSSLNQTTTFNYFPDTDSDQARAGQLENVTDPLNHITQYATVSGFATYTPFGSAESMTDPNSVVTQYTYDARGRMRTSEMVGTAARPTAYLTATVYDAAGRLTNVIRPSGNSSALGYDTSDRLTSLTRVDLSNAQQEQATYAYDYADEITGKAYRLCTSPAPSCPSWTQKWSQGYVYDPKLANLTQTNNADSTSQEYTYSPQGNLATFNDENHPSGAADVSDKYDLSGRRLSELHYLAGSTSGVTTQYSYDLHDNVTTATDPNGNVTTYTHDDFDRLESETSPVSGVTTYTYDGSGNMVSKVDANKNATTYTYDALNRLTIETDDVPNDPTHRYLEQYTFAYDDPTVGIFAIGRMSAMTDPTGSTKYAYDVRGLVETENHSITNGSTGQTAFVTNYRYDADGNRQQVEYPDKTIVGYTYDFADRPTSAKLANTLNAAAHAFRSPVQTMASLRSEAFESTPSSSGEPAAPFPQYRPRPASIPTPAPLEVSSDIVNQPFRWATPAPLQTFAPGMLSHSLLIGARRRTGEGGASASLRSLAAPSVGPTPFIQDFSGFPHLSSVWGLGDGYTLFPGSQAITDPTMPGGGVGAQIHYQAHSSGFTCPNCNGAVGGVEMKMFGPAISSSAVYLKYYLKFPVGFDWGLEGKLPGMYGAEPSGNIWKVRVEWHNAGGLTHCPGSTCGGGVVIYNACTTAEVDAGRGNWNWSADGNWHSVEMYVNPSGNGTIDIWYDGKQVVTTTFSCATDQNIIGFLFQSFYGGNDTKYGPSVDTDAYFGTVQSSTSLIGPTPMPSPPPSPTPSPTPTPLPASAIYVSSASYLPFGPLTSITYGNGTYQGLFFTPRYLPLGERLTAGTTTLASYSFTEDAVGNIKTVVDNLNAGYDRQYGYDDLNRLTTATSGANLWGTATGDGYRYDAMGNVLNVQLGNTRRAFTYYKGSGNGGNPNSVIPEVSSATINGVSTPIAFDLAGNNAGGGIQNMRYDAREQMVSTSAQPGGAQPIVQSYLYDGFHQRVATALANGKIRDSIYDSDKHLISETPQFTAGTTPGQPYDYIWFGDRPVAQIDPTGVHWTYADHLGTPFMQTDVSGTPTWRAEYEPYGSAYALRAGDVHQPLRLPGQSAEQFDMGANGFSPLSYNNARWYQPNWGQYTQPDPRGLSASSNLFDYVDGQPLNSIDFDGLTLTSNWNFFWSWATGGGQRDRYYGPHSIETQEMKTSPGGDALRNAFYNTGCSTAEADFGSIKAALDTILNPLEWGSTALQVGGFARASAINNGDGTVTFAIPNVAGTKSFFYHAVKDRTSPTGPFRSINQTFEWSETIDISKCKCSRK